MKTKLSYLLKIISLASLTLSHSSVCAQLYTPNGTIQGASSNGNVGIGVANPSAKLDIDGTLKINGLYPYFIINPTKWASPAYIRAGINLAQNAEGDYFSFMNASNKGFAFQRGQETDLLISSSGNIGIGTVVPNTKLAVNSNENYNWVTTFTNSSLKGHSVYTGYNNGATRYGLYIAGGGGDANSYDILISNKFTVRGDGNVGIGTTTPEAKLSVFNTASAGHLMLLANDNPSADLTRIDIDFKVADRNQTIGRISSVYYDSPQGGSGGLRFYSRLKGSLEERMRIDQSGNVGIGTTTPDAKLAVKGLIHTQEVKVDLQGAMVPDYVFANDYKLKSLYEVERYIQKHHHLPEIPSAKTVEKNGVLLGEMNMSLLKKIEELTLYAIEQEKKIKTLEKQNTALQELTQRLSVLEEQMAISRQQSAFGN